MSTSRPGTREQRVTDRFDTHLPVHVAGGGGATHNVSRHGVYFETDVQHRVGSLVNFSIEYRMHGRKHRVLCEGKVVRVERRGQRLGVAARFVAPFFGEPEEVTVVLP